MGNVRRDLARFEETATKVGVALVLLAPVTGMIAGMLGVVEVYPYDYAVHVAVAATCAPVWLAVLLGSAGGMYIMGGWRFVPAGVAFALGFVGLVLGLVLPSIVLRDVSIVALAIGGATFYYLGVRSRRAPVGAVRQWGSPLSMVGGALIAVIGYWTDVWGLLLFGAMATACGLGSWVAVLQESRLTQRS